MKQICSIMSVMEIFFKEPTKIHFIREIGRKINLAQTSTKNNIKKLEKEGLIIKKHSKPFDGFIANRENEKFLYYKQIHNLYSLYDIKNKLIQEFYPKSLVLFGSYLRGEDNETSDIDLLIVSKIKKNIDLSKLEENLKRKVHLTFVKDIPNLDKELKNKIKNGFVLYGESS